MEENKPFCINLQGQTALITGGASGIGAAIARKLAASGANLVLVDRKTPEAAEDFIRSLKNTGTRVFSVSADVSDFSKAVETVNAALNEFGRLDILINNAGINRDGVIWKMTEEQWDEVIDVNLKGCFNFIRAVSPFFREQKSGRIVNITSINGMRGKFGQVNYSASKAGIIGLTKSVAKELGKYGVNVNAVAPGLIETDMMMTADESVRSAALEEIVLKRLGQPDDVANAVVFLCSAMSVHITGEILRVDGGQYI